MKKLLLVGFSLALCCSSAFAAQYVYSSNSVSANAITSSPVVYKDHWCSLNSNDVQYGGYVGPGIVTMKLKTDILYHNQGEGGIYIKCKSIYGPVHTHITAGDSFSCEIAGNTPPPALAWYADKTSIFGAAGTITGTAPTAK